MARLSSKGVLPFDKKGALLHFAWVGSMRGGGWRAAHFSVSAGAGFCVCGFGTITPKKRPHGSVSADTEFCACIHGTMGEVFGGTGSRFARNRRGRAAWEPRRPASPPCGPAAPLPPVRTARGRRGRVRVGGGRGRTPAPRPDSRVPASRMPPEQNRGSRGAVGRVPSTRESAGGDPSSRVLGKWLRFCKAPAQDRAFRTSRAHVN